MAVETDHGDTGNEPADVARVKKGMVCEMSWRRLLGYLRET
jgi:hypothetical protein